MAGSSGASEASFDVSFETDIGDFYARDVELVEELIQANSNSKLTSPENIDIDSSSSNVILDPDDKLCLFCVLYLNFTCEMSS